MALEDLIDDEDTGELVVPEQGQRRMDAPVRPRRRSIDLDDDAMMQLRELAQSARRIQGPANDPIQPVDKPLGLTGTIREGAKGTLRALGATVDTMQGDAQGVVEAAQAQANAPKDPDLERFYQHIEERKRALGEDPSIWEGIKAVGGAAIDNPRGFGLMIAEQLPNSGAALGAGAAGALAGSFAGPIGATIGGLAGLATANIGLETGHKALEAGADMEFTPEEQSRVRREGLTKGAVITGIDAATLGLTNFITSTSRRAVERATIKTLADRGVDVASDAARRAAMETPEIAEAVRAAQDMARRGAETLGKRLARTGGAVALETVGEGAGEYLGELAATGKANAVDAVIEGFAGLGTSIGEITTTSALNRRGLRRLLDTQEEAEKTASEQTKETGVEHEVIPSPTEPEKFVAVPKTRTVSGIQLERDGEGNLKPVQPKSTQTDFNLANKPEFEHTAEDRIRRRQIEAEREAAYARNTIVVAKDMPPTIAGRTAGDMTTEALEYAARRGSERAKKIATDELAKRAQAGNTAKIPESAADKIKRIVGTGSEKAQEGARKNSILAPVPLANTQPAATMPAAGRSTKTPKPAPVTKVESVPKPEQRPVKPESATILKINKHPADTASVENIKGDEKQASSIPETGILKPKSASARSKEAARKLADHFTSGNIVKGYGGYDRVISFNKRENDWDVTVQRVQKDEKGAWVATGPVRTHATLPDARSAIVERAQLTKEQQTHPLRPHIESLIKRRSAASQTGKERSLNNAINRAKEAMEGKRTDTALESKWFRAQAATMRKADAETADILSRIGETIKSAGQSKDNGGTESGSEKGQQRLDHGELNIKGRTDNINRDLDKFKKEQAELAKTKAKETAQQTREQKALAKSLLDEHGERMVERYKAKFGEKEIRKTLDQWAKWEPKKLISFVDKFLQETASEKTKEKAKPAVAVRRNQKPIPRGGRILANGIVETIQKQGGAALVGHEITSPERLAELAQVYRDPRYETFRIFFTKGNTIVQASGVTSRLPGSAPLFPQNMGFDAGMAWIRGMMESSGADGYWMLHNHPSGNPTPSKADVNLTDTLAANLPGFKGHVVINSNKYAHISIAKSGDSPKSQVITKDFGEDMLLKASKPHEYIGRSVGRPENVVELGKSFQKEGWVTLIGTSGATGVRAIAEVPAKTFTNQAMARAAIRRFARRTGSSSVFSYGSEKDISPSQAKQLIADGFLRDAVNDAGKSLDGGILIQTMEFGTRGGEGGRVVRQNASTYSATTSALRDRFDKIADSLIYNFQDRFKPLKDIQKRAGAVSEDADAALAEERYSGTVRARLDTFNDQMRDPLLKAIHDSGVPYEDVEKYLHALHAPSRNAAMQEINPTESELKNSISALETSRDRLAKDAEVKRFLDRRRELRQAEADIEDGIADESIARVLKNDLAQLQRNPNVSEYMDTLERLKALRLVKPFEGDNTALSGMSDKQAADILAKAEKDGTKAKLDRVSDIINSITNRTRQIYVEGGLEKADTIDAWNRKYENYVPLHRDEVGGNTMPKVGQGFNIKGKESKRATGSTKEVTDILAHVVAQHEAAIIRSEKARVDRALFQFASTHPDPSLWTLDNAPMLRTVDPVSGFVVERVDPTYKNRPEVLTLKIDGEEHTITFNEQNPEAMRLAASMKNLASNELGEVTQMVGRITRFLATMNTTANPVFVARNFMRDLQTAYVNLSDTALAAKKAEVFRDIPSAIKGMWALSRGRKNSQWAKYAQEFKDAGGQTGWMEHYKDIGTRADALKKELAAMQPGKLNTAKRTLKKWRDIVEDANNAVENGARLAAFVNARRSGLSAGKAASLAKNLTVNFNARGAKSVELNAWYMFMNASIQGSARLIKAMNNRQVRKIVAGVVLSGFLLDIMARAMAGDDDEDGENDYDQLPEHTKAMNFVFMMGGQPVTIPMPYGYNFFASTGRKVSEMIFRENYSPVRSAVDLASVFLDAFSPVGQAGSALQFAAPTVADPFVQWAENKNFAGNPLRKDQSSFGVPKPEYQMGFKSTSAPAKWLAETLNETTGGNEVRPGFINVNPAFFDFTVSSIAGGAGRTYLQTVSAPAKAAGDDEIQAREIPFLNIFVGARPEYQTERKYFEAAAAVELAHKEMATYREKGDIEMARQLRAEHGAELRLKAAADEAKKILSRLRKMDHALDKVDVPDKAQRRRELEERKRQIMARFNRQYLQAITAEP